MAQARRVQPKNQRKARPRSAALAPGAFALTREYRLAPLGAATEDAISRLRLAHERYALEPVLEGHRVLVARWGDSVRIVSSDLRDWTSALPRIRRALAGALDPSAVFVLEGTLCALDAQGRPSFDRLKELLATGSDLGVVLVLADMLREGERDLRGSPLADRREALQQAWGSAQDPLAIARPLDADLDTAMVAVRGVGLRQIAARPLAGVYPPPKDDPWLLLDVDGDGPAQPRARHLSASPNVTNATKVLFPRDGFTKTDVFAYYREIAPFILPLMRDRPIVAQRWPDGIDDFTWYQHRVPPRAPDYVGAVMVEDNRRILVENEDALLWLVNQAALTLHGFASRVKTLRSPDWLILDLDPGSETVWAQTIEIAIAMRRLLELLEVESMVKTSGQKGIHVLVPLAPDQDQAQVQEAARRIAEMIHRLLPGTTTLETERDKRHGRLLIDTTQGFVGKILVLPYSLRAADGGPVSTPLAWEEVTPRLDPKAFHLKALRARLDARGDLTQTLLRGKTDAAVLLKKLTRS